MIASVGDAKMTSAELEQSTTSLRDKTGRRSVRVPLVAWLCAEVILLLLLCYVYHGYLSSLSTTCECEDAR